MKIIQPNIILLTTTISILIIIKQTFAQQTFYFEDQNIRFYQVTLIPTNGSVISANQSQVVFKRPTDFIDNVTNTQLALCGFSLQNQMNMEYDATAKYSSGTFTITIQAYNQTIFQYLSFYVIIYKTQATSYFQARSTCAKCLILNQNPNKNRSQIVNFTMATTRNQGMNFYVRAFIRSMKARQGGNGYTRMWTYWSFWNMFSTKLGVVISSYESIITQACITVVALSYSVIGPNYTYLIKQQTVRQFAAASIKGLPKNFQISSVMYGPIFNKRCIIGFQHLYFRDGIKQIFFDTTKAGIQNMVQNTPQYFYAQLCIFCVTRMRSCAFNQGIQTGIQQCANCSVMIKNCAFCLTQSQCTQCVTGYYIDKSKKCCPNYLQKCAICSLSNTCTQCVDGYYPSQSGSCALCTSPLPNCYRCTNSTFCYQCQDGYQLSNFTTCTKINSTNTNSTDNNNSTSNNTNNDSSQSTTTTNGLSLWQILFIAFAGACALLLIIVLIICIRWKSAKNKQNINDQKQNNINPNQKVNENINSPSKQFGIPQNLNQQMGLNQSPTNINQQLDLNSNVTSMQNHKMATDHYTKTVTQDYINQSQLQPPSGMAIRMGSKFQSYFTNLIVPKQNNQTNHIQNKPVKDKDPTTLYSGKQKSRDNQNIDSLISSGMQKSNQMKSPNQLNEFKNPPQSERGFLKKQPSFLPQISKATKKYGGSIHLKANYYK